MSAAAELKVSVVIATYRSGKGLDRLIRSLDAQTLPHDEWEAIFVDDGSPDDTYERLGELAKTAPTRSADFAKSSTRLSRSKTIQGVDTGRRKARTSLSMRARSG